MLLDDVNTLQDEIGKFVESKCKRPCVFNINLRCVLQGWWGELKEMTKPTKFDHLVTMTDILRKFIKTMYKWYEKEDKKAKSWYGIRKAGKYPNRTHPVPYDQIGFYGHLMRKFSLAIR